jgi:AraC-like DNA-binding protein
MMRRLSTEALSVVQSAGLISRLAYARGKRAGVDIARLLRRAGFAVGDINDESARLAVAKQIKFVELVAQLVGDPSLGFHLALEFDLRRIGLLYYVAASSKTLGEALQRVQRCSKIINEGIILTVRREETLRICFKYDGIFRHTDKHQIEFWMTALVRALRHLTNYKIQASRVSFAHARSGKNTELKNFFGGRIEDVARKDIVELPLSAWHLPVAKADPYLNRFLVQVCEEARARRQPGSSSFKIRVGNAIAELLPHGRTDIGTIAAKLQLSPRQLARRLSSERLTFAELLQDLRKTLARRYLANKDLSVSRIAWLLGYKEVGTFTRASRRWTGRPPSALRVRQKANKPLNIKSGK